MSDSIRSPRGAPTLAYALHGNLYLNLTNRCTLRCRFCPKFRRTWDVRGYGLRLGAEPCAEDLLQAVGVPAHCREVVFCGLGEPTLRLPVLLEVAHTLKEQGVRTRLNTDGLANWVHGRDVTAELGECLDAVSVSLNAQNAQVYGRHCRPPDGEAYPSLLEFIAGIRRRVPQVTATAIDGLPGVDIAACRVIAERLGVGFRRRVLDEVG